MPASRLTKTPVAETRYPYSRQPRYPPEPQLTRRGRHLFPSGWSTVLDVAPACTHPREEGEPVLEAAVLIGGVTLAALGLVVGFNARAEWAERDQLRRFQRAMRDADSPTPQQRED